MLLPQNHTDPTAFKAKLEDNRAKARSGEYQTISSRKKVTYNVLAEKYLELYNSEQRDHYIETFKQHFGPLKLIQIGALEIENFRAERKATQTIHKKERENVTVNIEL